MSPHATVISKDDKREESKMGLIDRIGSTGSGTGAALMRRVGRSKTTNLLACDHSQLAPFLADTSKLMRMALNRDEWIVVEGTQGFGLSVLHGGHYPHATSRDTTAGGFIGEAGLSPLDVEDVTLVIRAHPIRVAGNSGSLSGETSWSEIAEGAGLPGDYCERTTATKKVRRVGTFDPELVRRAIEINNPSRIVLNHFDYVDIGVSERRFSHESRDFLESVETEIGQRIDWIGIGPKQSDILAREEVYGKPSLGSGEVRAPIRTEKLVDAVH